jgi:hypothetical protein
MIHMALSQAAFDAIAATMLFGSVNCEAKINAKYSGKLAGTFIDACKGGVWKEFAGGQTTSIPDLLQKLRPERRRPEHRHRSLARCRLSADRGRPKCSRRPADRHDRRAVQIRRPRTLTEKGDQEC